MESATKYRGITSYEFLGIIGSYVFFALLYGFTLWYSLQDIRPASPLASLMTRSALDYLLKLTLSIPVWWVIFKKCRSLSLSGRLLIHVITLPLFVVLWQKLFYLVTERLYMYHLTGPGRVWDIYIPALFYIMQFSILHAYDYFQENQQKQRTEAQLREAALKSELSALKAQLNPHFLNNVFNTINASIPSQLENTRQMIASLSDLFRYQLHSSKTELVTLRNEIDFTRKYLDLEKARFGERLQVYINVADDVLDEPVPPMIIQPLVENSLRHGLSPLIEGGSVSITIVKENGQLEFTITDTGTGVKDLTKLMGIGVGLTNTELRLNKMYGSSLRISRNQPSGLKVQFAIA